MASRLKNKVQDITTKLHQELESRIKFSKQLNYKTGTIPLILVVKTKNIGCPASPKIASATRIIPDKHTENAYWSKFYIENDWDCSYHQNQCSALKIFVWTTFFTCRRRHQFPTGQEHLRLFIHILYEHQQCSLKRAQKCIQLLVNFQWSRFS